MGSSPLGCGIGWRDKLRDNVAGSAPGRIIEGCQILLHRAAGAPRIAVLVPVLTRDRPLLVCVSLDQARVNRKAFATNQTGRNASFNDTFEHATEYISSRKRSLRARENAE